MKISYEWLKDYVCFDLSPQMLAEKLTNAGLVVAGIEPVEDDYCVDIEITANRSDCLGFIGIAREVAAMTKGNIQRPELGIDISSVSDDVSQFIKVEVKEPILCPEYTARVVRNITVKPSPEWLQKRLKCIGLRPVNNVVDITNYIMMESGQPLHAFDLDKVAGRQIQVRKAESGEEIVAINGARRVLFHDMLVIADEKRPIAIAGVMGGKETEVTESTKNILIECARFEPRQVRRTSKSLGIVSDSSCRFERGTDPLGLDYASKRTAKLIFEHAGGEICKGVIDVGAVRNEAKKVVLRIDRLQKILGLEINRDVIPDILTRLQFKILNYVDNFIDVEIPSFRGDVSREIDLIEEVSRMYGYNNIPTKTSISIRGSKKSKYETVEDFIREILIGLGFYETKTFSIVNYAFLGGGNLWISEGEEAVEIVNPLRQEESVLRTSLLPSLIRVKMHNANHGYEQVKLFEIAKVYLKREKLPHEKNCLSLLEAADFFEGKGIVQLLLKNLKIHAKCEWVNFNETRLFKNERAAKILLDGKTIGYLGEASKELGFKTLCTLLELDMDALVEKANFDKKYRTPSPYPMIMRDFAILVDEGIAWASIENCINNLEISTLKEVHYFDIYRGKQIPEGKKSIAFNVSFQSHDRTLKSEEVDNESDVILDALYKKLGAELRKQ
ncbi:MAG: phenylalanine--tRNA ligase subunit beta [Candidatus Kuenenia sp.]|nr:phenylalanine--tRNA ligase subunit beta [Candidatus Kuenenia hertensis]